MRRCTCHCQRSLQEWNESLGCRYSNTVSLSSIFFVDWLSNVWLSAVIRLRECFLSLRPLLPLMKQNHLGGYWKAFQSFCWWQIRASTFFFCNDLRYINYIVWVLNRTFYCFLIFHRYHTEHELLRYINLLLSKGSLPVPQRDSIGNLGSCIMKLNATTEMIHWLIISARLITIPADCSSGTVNHLSSFLASLSMSLN